MSGGAPPPENRRTEREDDQGPHDAQADRAPQWRKSSYSTGGSANCVQYAHIDDNVWVGDTWTPQGPRISFTAASWCAFLRAVRSDELV